MKRLLCFLLLLPAITLAQIKPIRTMADVAGVFSYTTADGQVRSLNVSLYVPNATYNGFVQSTTATQADHNNRINLNTAALASVSALVGGHTTQINGLSTTLSVTSANVASVSITAASNTTAIMALNSRVDAVSATAAANGAGLNSLLSAYNNYTLTTNNALAARALLSGNNTFTGNQSITGNGALTGKLGVGIATALYRLHVADQTNPADGVLLEVQNDFNAAGRTGAKARFHQAGVAKGIIGVEPDGLFALRGWGNGTLPLSLGINSSTNYVGVGSAAASPQEAMDVGTGWVRATGLTASGDSPTIAPGAAAGTGATTLMFANATRTAGAFQINSGSANTAASGIVATLTLPAGGKVPKAVIIQGVGDDSRELPRLSADWANVTATSIPVKIGSGAFGVNKSLPYTYLIVY